MYSPSLNEVDKDHHVIVMQKSLRHNTGKLQKRNWQKVTKRTYTIQKKAYKKSKTKHPKPVTRDRNATGIGFGSQIKESCNRQRITPDRMGCQGLRRIRRRHRRRESPSTGESLVVPLMRSEISYLRLEKKVLVFVERLDSLVPRVLVYVHICVQSEQKNSRGISENETLILFSEAYIYASHWVSFPCDIHWVHPLDTCRVSPQAKK